VSSGIPPAQQVTPLDIAVGGSPQRVTHVRRLAIRRMRVL
jgi:hypothetical protein